MIKNDTNNLFELQNFYCENRLFTFRVGERVGEPLATTFNLFQDDLFLNFQHFDTNLQAEKSVNKKRPKIYILRGLKLRWLM